jgi:biotin carboxylase
MNILMISPAYPPEMGLFTRALSDVGAQVIGLADVPAASLPEQVRHRLAAHIPVPDLWDEAAVIESLRSHPVARQLDRVECLWEPGMMLAAAIRQAFDLPGLTREQTNHFRDKELMKQALDAAGLRTPRHARAVSEDEVRQAVERIGYPLILKPIAGAGSADTYQIDDSSVLEKTLPRMRHVAEVSVEEFIRGQEFTFDTICVDGRVEYFNISHYRPNPLIARTEEWISPQTLSLRDVESERLASGRELGKAALRALDYRTGFTHMEWFLTDNGEAVFGEIAARPPGARSVDLMNHAAEIDTYLGWAEAVALGRFERPIGRRYNSAIIFKRARGEGRILKVEGLRRFLSRHGEHVMDLDLLPVGSRRRNWKQTLVSDGYCLIRHPDLDRTMAIADAFGAEVNMVAGG